MVAVTPMTDGRTLGEHLIFLISLPRTGSTLLQHIIASHSTVASAAEPWILLPAVYALRENGLRAEYNADIGQIALTEFLQQLGDGEDRYYGAVRRMALELYDSFLADQGKERFLDKTSRYYLMLPELFRIFPRARYVFLVRNPLAVLASYLEVMVQGNWRRFSEPGIRNDLLDGHKLIQRGIEYLGDDATLVRYEDLVTNPEIAVRVVCRHIDLKYEPGMLDYGAHGLVPGTLVDPKSIHRHRRPVTDYTETWRSRFRSTQELELAQGFLAHLGCPLVERLGYSYHELLAGISGRAKRAPLVVSWQTLVTPPEERGLLQNRFVDLAYRYQKEGVRRALYHMAVDVYRKARWALPVATREKCQRPTGWHPLRGVLGRIPQRFDQSRSSRGLQVSTDYHLIKPTEISDDLLQGWQDERVAARMLAAYRPLLEAMYRGKTRRDFAVAAECLRIIGIDNPTILEIGCGSGYYWEVLSHLYRGPLRYVGLDYSEAMVTVAREEYPQITFIVADALAMPFADDSLDIAWSGTILMHLPEYDKAISSTCRVARRFCVFHSVPVRSMGPTLFLRKNAYGVPVAEVLLNRVEFEQLLHTHGLRIRHILESLPYRAGNLADDMETLTYICEKSASAR